MRTIARVLASLLLATPLLLAPGAARAQANYVRAVVLIKCTVLDELVEKGPGKTKVPKCDDLNKGKDGWVNGQLDWLSEGTKLFSEDGPFYVSKDEQRGEVMVFVDGNGDPARFDAWYADPATSVFHMRDVSFELWIQRKSKPDEPMALAAAQPFTPVAVALTALSAATVGKLRHSLAAGTGLSGGVFDGSADATFSVDYGAAPRTAVEGSTGYAITTGLGLSGGASGSLGDGINMSIENTGIVTINTRDPQGGGAQGNFTIGGGRGLSSSSTTGQVQIDANTGRGLAIDGDDIVIPNGGVDNAMLASDSIIVGAGAGLTGGGPVALGGAVTLSADDDSATNELNTGVTFDGRNLTVTDPGGARSADLSALADNTDDQTLSLNGNSLGIEDGNAVDLSSYLDNTDSQDLSLAGNALSLTGDATPVDLSGYLDNTDNQTVSIDPAHNLAITGGNQVSLAPYLDNTDSQTVAFDGSNLSISGGNAVDSSGLRDDADADPANELNTGVTFDGRNLSVTDRGGSLAVDLSALSDNTDDQQLSYGGGNSFSLEDGGSVALSGLDAATLGGTAPGGFNQGLTAGTGIAIGGALPNQSVGLTPSYASGAAHDGRFVNQSGDTMTGTLRFSARNAEAIRFANGATIRGTTAGGRVEEFLTPRAADNGTYLRFGSGGMHFENAAGNEQLAVAPSGIVNIRRFAGAGLRMVVAQNTGNLATAAMPVNTDAQTLAFDGGNLEITGGNSVDLSGLRDGTGTDDQNLTAVTLNGTTLQIDIEGGTSASVDLSALAAVDDADADPANELNASLTLNGSILQLTDAGGTKSVDLGNFVGTDDQNLTGATLDGTTLTVDIEGGTSATVDLTDLFVKTQTLRRAFITSASFGYNMGGLDGADALCQAAADASGIQGTFRAWLSSSTGSPSTRFTTSPAVPTGSWTTPRSPRATPTSPMDPWRRRSTSTRTGIRWRRTREHGPAPWRTAPGGAGTARTGMGGARSTSRGKIGVVDTDGSEPAGAWTDAAQSRCSPRRRLLCFQQDVTAETLDQLALQGTDLVMTNASGSTSVSLDPLKNSALILDGTDLKLTDAGGTLSASLAPLKNSALILEGTDLKLTDAAGTLSASLSPLLEDTTNELNTSLAVAGRTLELTDAGGTLTADLSVTLGHFRYVFVTSGRTRSSSVDSGDSSCAFRAQQAGLPGQYRAWFSQAQGNRSPSTGFSRSPEVPYLLPNGDQVAASYADLTDGTLSKAINIDEQGNRVPNGERVWTGTRSDGTLYEGRHCEDWDPTRGEVEYGRYGEVGATNGAWSSSGSARCLDRNDRDDDAFYRIYCFQQDSNGPHLARRGTDLQFIGAGSTSTASLGDFHNSSLVLSGTNLRLTDGAGTLTASLAPIAGWSVSGDDMHARVSGNVGIGENSPAHKLDVHRSVGTGAATRALIHTTPGCGHTCDSRRRAAGYLAVNGTADFDGHTGLGLDNAAIGVLGIADWSDRNARRWGVYGYADQWGGGFENSNSGSLVKLGGGTWAGQLTGPSSASTAHLAGASYAGQFALAAAGSRVDLAGADYAAELIAPNSQSAVKLGGTDDAGTFTGQTAGISAKLAGSSYAGSFTGQYTGTTVRLGDNGGAVVLDGYFRSNGWAWGLSANLGTSEDDVSGFDDVSFSGDDACRNVSMGFVDVEVEGVRYRRACVCTNGYIEFVPSQNTSCRNDSSNSALPTSEFSRPAVFAYWDDLDCSSVLAGDTGGASNPVFVVKWDCETDSGNYETDFEVQVHDRSHLINVRYFNMHPSAIGQSATIGFQTGSRHSFPIGSFGEFLDDNADDGDSIGQEGWSVSPLR